MVKENGYVSYYDPQTDYSNSESWLNARIRQLFPFLTERLTFKALFNTIDPQGRINTIVDNEKNPHVFKKIEDLVGSVLFYISATGEYPAALANIN